MSIFAASRESQESFPTFEFSDSSVMTKRGREGQSAWEKAKGNTLAGTIVREPKIVDVNINGSTEKKMILTFEVDHKATKGFVVNSETKDKDPITPATPIVILWVNVKGNLIANIDKAVNGDDSSMNGRYMTITLSDLKDTGKQNLAKQYTVTAGAVPERNDGVDPSELD